MLELVQNENKFYEMRNAWNSLLEKSGVDNPYLTHEWLASWWKAYKGNKGLNIILFKEQDKVIGAIPLTLSKEAIFGIPIRIIRFFSDHWGRMDFILTEKRAECIAEFLDWFHCAKMADVVILSRIPEDSKNAGIIEKVIKDKEFSYEKQELKNTVIILKDDWEAYLKQLTKKFRYEIKNKQKKLFALENVRYERITEVEDADKVLPSLVAVGAKSWKYKDKKGVVVSMEGEQFYRNIISEWGKTKKLDISLIKQNDLPIAFTLRVKHKDTLYALETAYDKDFYSYSPGLVINSILLEKLLEEKALNKYELGEISDSKKRWSENYSCEVKLNIYNKTAKMRFLFLIKKLKTKSLSQIFARAIKVIGRKFFIKAKCELLKFRQLPMDTSILEQFKVTLKEISPDEIYLLSDKEYYSKKIWDNRWQQGAQLLGAIWNGRIVEYCWIISDSSYRDIFDSFYIKLNPGECYLFDYRALKGKPDELRHFRIMKVLTQFVFHLMKNRFPDCKNICYTAVEEHNGKSLFFFKRYFHAELLANITFYRFLFWEWRSQKSRWRMLKIINDNG